MEEGISLTYRSCSLTTSLGTSEHEPEFASCHASSSVPIHVHIEHREDGPQLGPIVDFHAETRHTVPHSVL